VEEADETTHWLELIMEAQLVPPERVEALHKEAEQLMRLFAKTRRTTINNKLSTNTKPPSYQTAKRSSTE
jgi:hypothetical protein